MNSSCEQTPTHQSGNSAPIQGWSSATHWSVVLEAGQAGSQSAPQALERLCRTYWSPIYAYIRRRGFGPEEAQDLTQGFFLHWLQNNALSAVDRNKGRFRSFLLVCLKNFLSNEWDRARRQKRGGGQRMLSLETEALESECSASADPKLTPEKVFDRRWALMILDHTLEALRAEQVQAGKARQFEKLACFLSAEGTAESYASLAAELELSREAVAMAVWRLRQRFRTLLLQEIRGMVSSPEQVKEELACLMAALRD